MTPGIVSCSTSRSADFWISAKFRIWVWAELDVGPLAGAHPVVAGVDGAPAQAEVGRRPAIKALRVLANRRVAARLDVRQHFLHGPADRRVRIRLGVFAQPGLEVAGHGTLLPFESIV